MKAYELLFFVAPTLEEDARANVMGRIENVITAGEGTVDNVDNWGKRKLAYEINLSEGDYILVDFNANPDHIEEIDRILRINDNVQRHMIVVREDRD